MPANVARKSKTDVLIVHTTNWASRAQDIPGRAGVTATGSTADGCPDPGVARRRTQDRELPVVTFFRVPITPTRCACLGPTCSTRDGMLDRLADELGFDQSR